MATASIRCPIQQLVCDDACRKLQASFVCRARSLATSNLKFDKLTGVPALTCQRYCLFIGLVFTFLGCGGGSETVPVTGTVTYKGKPIGKINVFFVPADNSGAIAQGTSDENGKFSLQTLNPNDGAKPGDYKVAFKYISDIIPDMPGFVGGIQPEKSPLPLKYEDENKSGHTATVKDSDNEFTFDLK